MGLFDEALTKDDFEDANWQEVISSSPMKECLTYTSFFQTKAEEVRKSGDTKQEAVFGLLSFITWFVLRLDSAGMPLGPRVILHGVATSSIDDIPDAYLEVLKEIAPTITDPEMQARVTDILWVRQRSKAYAMAKLAIPAYLASAEILNRPQYGAFSNARIERALQIAASLGRTSPELDQVITHIERLTIKYTSEKQWPRAARMHELLRAEKRGDPSVYAPMAEISAKQLEAEGKWYLAERFWKIKANWHFLAEEPDEERSARIQAAETHIKQADNYLNLPSPSYLNACHHIEDAIEAYRSFGSNKERVAELHKLLLEYQPRAFGQLRFMKSETLDTSEFEEPAAAAVKDKSILDALYALATITKSPKVSFLRRRIKKRIDDYLLYYLFGLAHIDNVGKTKARRPAFSSESDDEKENAILVEMYSDARRQQGALAMALIEPAREQIKLEHGVRVRDFNPIVYNNRFVPPSHAHIYAEGLHAGLMGDFLVACHLLAPQLENSIRYILNQTGAITSGFDAKRIQDEDSLNVILDLPEMRQLFDEDTIFDLKGLLAEQFGSNLRNEMAHGLMPYNRFWSAEVAYLWWLALRLCCLFRIVPSLVQTKIRRYRASELSKKRNRPRGFMRSQA